MSSVNLAEIFLGIFDSSIDMLSIRFSKFNLADQLQSRIGCTKLSSSSTILFLQS